MKTILSVATLCLLFTFASWAAAGPDNVGRTNTFNGQPPMRMNYLRHVTEDGGDIPRELVEADGKKKEADGKKKDDDSKKSGAWQYGYNEASYLWDDGYSNKASSLMEDGKLKKKYKCNSFFDVTDVFWSDIQNKVFKDCKSKYSLWGKEDDCKDGAEAYTLDQASACVALSDCYMLGDVTADGVSSLMCPASENIAKSNKQFFPPNCADFATIRCQISAIERIDGLAKKGNCGDLEDALDLSSKDLKKIEEHCDNEVDEFSKTMDPL